MKKSKDENRFIAQFPISEKLHTVLDNLEFKDRHELMGFLSELSSRTTDFLDDAIVKSEEERFTFIMQLAISKDVTEKEGTTRIRACGGLMGRSDDVIKMLYKILDRPELSDARMKYELYDLIDSFSKPQK